MQFLFDKTLFDSVEHIFLCTFYAHLSIAIQCFFMRYANIHVIASEKYQEMS